MNVPERITAARRALAEIETLEEAKAVVGLAETARVWARKAEFGLDAQNEAAEIKLLAERQGGLILKRMKENGERRAGHGDQKSGSHDAIPKLADLGVTLSQSSRWQALASLSEKEIRDDAEKTRDAGDEITTAAILKRLKRRAREDGLRAEREAAEQVARTELAAVEDACELIEGDLRGWRPVGVTSIITDPPYVGDAIPLYEALRDFAVDVLPSGAPLVVMTWQGILPRVIQALEHPALAYRWTICWRYDNSENTVDHARRVFDCWKPVLVYHKDEMPPDAAMMRDEIANKGGDKDFHEWGQALGGFERLIRTFSEPGGLVCDPFLGGGTTAIAALSQTRRFVGCDIDADAITTTRQRLEPA